jgi:hypothetical protein
VCRLGVEIKVSATDDILTSVLYGWFVEKIASYLYENRFDNELFKLTSHSLILKNCNPKFVSIQDRKVAEMYSSHYCQAYLSIQKFNFRIQYTKTPVDFMNTIKSVIEGCNEIYDISSNFSNEIYARMNKNNWSYFILYTFNRIKNDKANLEVNLLQDYISELEKASKKNTWILDILNQM